MTTLQKIQLATSEAKQRLMEIAGIDEVTDEVREEVKTLKATLSDLETRGQAALIADAEETASNEARFVAEGEGEGEGGDAEAREIRELRGKVSLNDYAIAATDERAADGAAGELNEVLGISRRKFPLELLARGREVRQDTAVDAGASQATWVDILFGDTAAAYIGVEFQSVPAGVRTLPILTTGSEAKQRGKGQDVTAAAWVAGVKTLKPKRQGVQTNYNHVDALRLPGLVDSLSRNMAAAGADAMDKAILSGDSSASPADGDVVGLETATGITEVTVTQGAKITGKGVTAALAEFIDGKHASMPDHVKIAASVGSNTLWLSNLVQSGNSVDTSIAQYLRAHGFSWMAREGIDVNTAVGDFGAYIGLSRMQAGAGVAAIWPGADMRIIDPYSDAAGGTVTMTLGLYWDWAPVRPSSFGRLKYVT